MNSLINKQNGYVPLVCLTCALNLSAINLAKWLCLYGVPYLCL